MSFNHAVVWLDHREAHIIHFNADTSTMETVRTRTGDGHLHHRSGTLGSGKVATRQSYLHEVVEGIADVQEILVMGPGSAKMELIKHAHKHDPAVAEKILGVETSDHPTDPQILAYAKRYFLKVDNLRGDNF